MEVVESWVVELFVKEPAELNAVKLTESSEVAEAVDKVMEVEMDVVEVALTVSLSVVRSKLDVDKYSLVAVEEIDEACDDDKAWAELSYRVVGTRVEAGELPLARVEALKSEITESDVFIEITLDNSDVGIKDDEVISAGVDIELELYTSFSLGLLVVIWTVELIESLENTDWGTDEVLMELAEEGKPDSDEIVVSP